MAPATTSAPTPTPTPPPLPSAPATSRPRARACIATHRLGRWRRRGHKYPGPAPGAFLDRGACLAAPPTPEQGARNPSRGSSFGDSDPPITSPPSSNVACVVNSCRTVVARAGDSFFRQYWGQAQVGPRALGSQRSSGRSKDEPGTVRGRSLGRRDQEAGPERNWSRSGRGLGGGIKRRRGLGA